MILKNITVLFILFFFCSCGQEQDNNNKLLPNLEIDYVVTDEGIKTLIFPLRVEGKEMNGISILNITYKKGLSGTIYSTVNLKNPITLDRNSCPVIHGYHIKAKCYYNLKSSKF